MNLHDLKYKKLNNGLRVFNFPSDSNEIVLHMTVGVGLEDETPKELDIAYSNAHIVEHIITDHSKSNPVEEPERYNFVAANTYMNFTTYTYVYHNFKHDRLSLKLIDELFNKEITAKEVAHERKIIEVEAIETAFPQTNPFNPLKKYKPESITKERLKEFEIETARLISKKVVVWLNKNWTQEHLTSFHKKYYIPSNVIIAFSGLTSKQFDNLVVELEKLPAAKDKINHKLNFKKNGQSLYLPENQFTIMPNPGDKSGYANVNIFFPVPPLKNEQFASMGLINFLLANNSTSSEHGELFNHLRKKRASVYTPFSQHIIGVENDLLYIKFITNNNSLRRALSGTRTLINKLATGKLVSTEEFTDLKTRTISTLLYYIDNIDKIDSLQGNSINLLFGSSKKTSLQYIHDIKKLRYDEFIKFAKYLSRTNNFKVAVEANDIVMDDLFAFDLKGKNNLYSNKDSKATFKYFKNQLPKYKASDEDKEFESDDEEYDEDYNEYDMEFDAEQDEFDELKDILSADQEENQGNDEEQTPNQEEDSQTQDEQEDEQEGLSL